MRDEVFDREEKLFRSLEKAVRQLAKNVQFYLLHIQVSTDISMPDHKECVLLKCLMCVLQEMVSVAVQKVQDMEDMIKDPNKNDINGSLHHNGNDPYKHFVSLAVLHNSVIRLIQGIVSLQIQLISFISQNHGLVCPCFAVLFPS